MPPGARVASTSAIDMPVIAIGASSFTEALAGAVPVTGSFAALTVTLITSLSLVPAPVPVATIPPTSSVTCNVMVAEPLKSGSDV